MPEEFLEKKLKNLINFRSGYTWGKEQESSNPVEGSVRVLTVSNIQQELDLSSELYLINVPEKEKLEKKAERGWSIAVGSNGNRKRIGNAVYINNDEEYLFASFLVGFKPKPESGLHPRYFYQWLTSYPVQERITVVSEGTTGLGNLNIRHFRNMGIRYPKKYSEQEAIVKIFETLDKALKATQNSIAQAQQLKKALMQHLLSGRLKPDGTWRKPDEFYVDEKFGRVPKGWRACAVADPSIADLEPNYDFVKGKEYAFIPMDALEKGFKGVRQIEYRVIESGGYSRFKNGDILFAKITPCIENGKVAMVEGLKDGLGFGSTEFIVISPKPIVDNWFLYYQLISGNVHRLAISLMEGTTGRQRIPAKIFRKRIFVSLPEDIDEQKKISEIIKGVEQLINTKQDKMTNLQIMKKSLMQNLLTGKIRVQAE